MGGGNRQEVGYNDISFISGFPEVRNLSITKYILKGSAIAKNSDLVLNKVFIKLFLFLFCTFFYFVIVMCLNEAD